MHGSNRCIFCKASTVGSVSIEHIVPASLGNAEHVLPRGVVCDNCNNYMANKVEAPLLNSDYFRQLRFRQMIPSKKGRIPSICCMAFPSGVVLEMGATRDGHQSIGPQNEQDNDRFMNILQTQHRFTAHMLVAPEPESRLLGRLLGKMGLEAMAARALPVPGGLDEIIDKPELDELRAFSRYDRSCGPWPFHCRRIYSEDFMFPSDGSGDYQVLHEYTLLYTEQREMYFIVALFGVEYAINMGGPELDGYRDWLSKHRRSPLY